MEYVPVEEFYGSSEENEFFATINPKYLIGPGPEVFLVTDLLQEQIAVYQEEKVNKLK